MTNDALFFTKSVASEYRKMDTKDQINQAIYAIDGAMNALEKTIGFGMDRETYALIIKLETAKAELIRIREQS